MDTTTQPRTNPRRILGRYAITLGLVVLLVGALGLVYSASQGDGNATNLDTADLDPAPDFTTSLYSGGTGQFTLSDQQGHPVVLNFWGSWCPPCRAEFPALQSAFDQYKEQGLVLFGVDVQDTEADAREFIDEQGTTFFTGPDLDGQITIDYGVLNFPTTFFITRDGKIYRKWISLIDDKNLTEIIEELLKV